MLVVRNDVKKLTNFNILNENSHKLQIFQIKSLRHEAPQIQVFSITSRKAIKESMPFLGPAPFYIKNGEWKNLATLGNLARSNALISKEHEHSNYKSKIKKN